MTDALQIPADLLPADGRFGAGPSKIQTSHLDALAATGATLMGTSHRQAPVRNTVGRVRDRVLGRRDVRPSPGEEPAPVLRGVLLEVRQGRSRRSVAGGAVGDQLRAG